MRLIATTVVLCAALVSTAGAVPPKQCNPLPHYTVIAHGVKCSFARKWVKRYVKHKAHPKHFTCAKPDSGSNVKVNCQGDEKPSGDPQYRYYYGIKR
jgi:hypothetical protein